MNDNVVDVASECSHYIGPRFIGLYRENCSAQFLLYVEGVILAMSHSFSELLMVRFSSFYALFMLKVCLFLRVGV